MGYIEYFNIGFLGGKTELIITSDFRNRKAPGAKKYSFHYGIDLRAASGTNITAPVSGEVGNVTMSKKGGLGFCLKTKDTDNTPFYIWFFHMHQCLFSKKDIGKKIIAGTLIGQSGGDPRIDSATIAGAYSTGPHLHLEVRKGGNDSAHAVDPKCYFLGRHVLMYANGTFYSENNYVGGVYGGAGTMFSSDATLTVTDVMSGVSLVNDLESLGTMSNAETEYDAPKKKRLPEAFERYALGIWQITKLLIDSSVQHKQICDSSISTQTGSILNFFNKVCQQPFVEFMGDTFGNQFYWLIRKPPFDREGFLRGMNSIRNISEDVIINRSFQYETEVYSWYRYIPTGDVLGVSEQLFMSPAVFFPEYAAIWGSKPLCIQSAYFNVNAAGMNNLDHKAESNNGNRIAKNIVADFKFIIECNAYRPFSRRGSVTIKGTRKIKRGTFVEFDDGEVFHVDAVSHSHVVSLGNAQQTTTLQLSHGIYKEYINNEKNSYFNIIDFGLDKEEVRSDNYRSIMSRWKVNVECFNFFYKKKFLLEK